MLTDKIRKIKKNILRYITLVLNILSENRIIMLMSQNCVVFFNEAACTCINMHKYLTA